MKSFFSKISTVLIAGILLLTILALLFTYGLQMILTERYIKEMVSRVEPEEVIIAFDEQNMRYNRKNIVDIIYDELGRDIMMAMGLTRDDLSDVLAMKFSRNFASEKIFALAELVKGKETSFYIKSKEIVRLIEKNSEDVLETAEVGASEATLGHVLEQVEQKLPKNIVKLTAANLAKHRFFTRFVLSKFIFILYFIVVALCIWLLFKLYKGKRHKLLVVLAVLLFIAGAALLLITPLQGVLIRYIQNGVPLGSTLIDKIIAPFQSKSLKMGAYLMVSSLVITVLFTLVRLIIRKVAQRRTTQL